MVLQILFFLLICSGDSLSEKLRYYLVGMGMILVVLLNVVASFGFSVYHTAVVLRNKWKKYEEFKEYEKNKLEKTSQLDIKSDDRLQ